ncbi:hypothetical protein WICMUC_001569 [Wickerhamomyces mucosus]|uniref:Pheromone-regulated membrane protein 10 n=1 Tax=Wickerhamomyces mucosus TaxID=1378264 RepID=A0A9P8TH98_9ASCO|nr:hypothetical protein WICMUC_001569 [Wickerhamomyces mucosus]
MGKQNKRKGGKGKKSSINQRSTDQRDDGGLYSISSDSSIDKQDETIIPTQIDPIQQRPPLRPSLASEPHLHHSSSSILTISKLYQQQQQMNSSSSHIPKQQHQHTSSGIRSSFTSKPLIKSTTTTTPPLSYKDKKLHKRVLSSNSLNDYFSNTSKSIENQTPNSLTEQQQQQQQQEPLPKLPKFQRMDLPPNNNNDQKSSSQSFDSNKKIESNDDYNINSSKIFERRKAREQNDLDDLNQEFLSNDGDNFDDNDNDELENDDELKQKYREKLNKLKDQNVEKDSTYENFYNTDSDSDSLKEHGKEEIEEEKKINHMNNSNNNDKVDSGNSKKSHELSRSETSQTNNKRNSHDITSMTSSTNDESKVRGGFRNVFKRFVLDEHDEEFEKMAEQDEDDNKEGSNFFNKFLNISGGGLVPGASKVDYQDKERTADEENQIITEDGIQLQQMDPAIFKQEAQDILQSHAATSSNSKNYLSDSDDQTLKDSSSSIDDSFLAPNPDLYLRDDDNYDTLNLDGGDDAYIAPPDRVRGGVLSSLLRLYQNPQEASRSRLSLNSDGGISPSGSAFTTPTEERDEFNFDQDYKSGKSIAGRLKNFAGSAAHAAGSAAYAAGKVATGNKKVAIDDSNLQKQQDLINAHRKNTSFHDLSQFKDDLQHLSPSAILAATKRKGQGSTNKLPTFSKNRPNGKRMSSSHRLKAKREQAAARITVHIADILQRQRFILRICKALMLYGAPTHRLEDFLTMIARVLEIDAQFIYFPGCMIVSFGDATTRTSEVQLVRAAQGLNLYKLHRVHRIYKKVIHDLISVENASSQLDDLLAQKPVFPPWACVIFYGIATASVTPFAFGGGWVNLPISFAIGVCVAILQFYIAPRSNLYSNVFEVAASIVVAFLGRALGSISGAGICFGAIVQGSLAIILPGYIILCGSLELQSRNLVAGAVRMFYAIIYSLFLGFGITLGAALYGWIDKNATQETQCSVKLDAKWNILFVPLFTLTLCLINQARFFQLPIMLFISCVGYIVNYFAAKHFVNSTEFTASVGAFVVGVLGNLYSRIWKGLAVSAMLPAIFVQVPGSIASKSSLLAGLSGANELTSKSTSSSSSSGTSDLSFGITMVQIAIGISVGLFASTIFVYPFGKKSTSVFTL